MTREINIRLNANRAKAVHTGHKFASGDKGIVFRIFVDELDTTGTTAKIVFKRSNGTSVEAGISETEGVYSYTTLGNEFAVVGPVVADVKFYEEEKRVSTCTFVFDVTSDTMDGLGAGAAGYSDTLEQMKKSMEQTESEMRAVEARAEEILQQMRDVAEGAEDNVEAAEKKMDDLTEELEALYREYTEAFGNTGPLNPRGPYSETETYTVRDMVSFNDASWVCYRNCTGEAPSKDSDCWQYFAAGNAENVQDIIDGTQQVGNAKTLDGHGAEYFLPKSGGTINGNVFLTSLLNELRVFVVNNSLRQVNVEVQQGGVFRLRDTTNSKDIINSTADGKSTFNGTASGNLPLIGGRLSKNKIIALEIENTAGNASVIDFYGADGRMGAIGFNGKNVPIYQPSEGGANTLLHTGNKPTGTYTGNGSATNRQIAVGGVSKALMIKRTGSGIVLVDQYSAYGITPSGVVSFTKAELNFTNGVLYMGTANEIVNVSGGDYDYYSL